MCRIALWNKQGEKLIEDKFGVEKFLLRLEFECGGQGNGLILVKDKKVIYTRKGLTYTSHSIVKTLQKNDYDYAIFHTRVKSVGEVSDNNCHPFKSGKTYLTMNGTEHGYSGLAKAMNITDTEALLLSIKKFNLPLLKTIKELSSNFMGVNDGTVFATSSHGTLVATKDDEGAIVIASSLPKEFKIYEPVDSPFVWTSDKSLKLKEKKEVLTSKYAREMKEYQAWKAIEMEKIRERSGIQYISCTDCGEILRIDELIEDRYCPICGEDLYERTKRLD